MKFFSIISQADISNRVTHWFGKGEGEGNAHRRTFLRVAAAALAAGILLASPQVKAVLCSAGEWLGNLAGGHPERFSDGFEIVDYGYDYVALRKTVSPLHQTLAVGDFEFTFQDLLCHDYLSGEYTDDLSTLAVPVRVAFKGDKETYGAYMPPYEMKFNLAGYRENKKVIELSFTYQGLFHEVGDEMYPVMDCFTQYYPTKFINGKPSPTNQYLTVYYGRIVYMDTDLLVKNYKQYLQAIYDANELFYGHEDCGPMGYYFDSYSDGTEDDAEETDSLANWNNGTKELYRQWIRECDRMSKQEKEEKKEEFDYSKCYDSEGRWEYSFGTPFAGYLIICALNPDRYEITTAELSTYTATGYKIVKTRSYNIKDTVYDSFVNRFVVKWKDMQKTEYRVVNRDYFDRLKRGNPEAAGELSEYTPVEFREIDD